jgi:hypothetical protein
LCAERRGLGGDRAGDERDGGEEERLHGASVRSGAVRPSVPRSIGRAGAPGTITGVAGSNVMQQVPDGVSVPLHEAVTDS